MLRSKKDAAFDLIRAAYLQPDQLEAFLQVCKTKAPLFNRKVKAGAELEETIAYIQSADFLGKVLPSFEDLTEEEMDFLTAFYHSIAMKKFHRVAQNLVSFYQAVENAFFE